MEATFDGCPGAAIKKGIKDQITVVRPVLETSQSGARINVVLDWYC